MKLECARCHRAYHGRRGMKRADLIEHLVNHWDWKQETKRRVLCRECAAEPPAGGQGELWKGETKYGIYAGGD